MKSAAYLVLGICLSFAIFIGYSQFSQTSSAQRATRNQWEYAAIVASYAFNPTKNQTNKINGMTLICYLQNNGCRTLEIKHELDYGTYLQERALPLQESQQTRRDASTKASEIAFQKAVAQLGSEGFELVSEPELNFEWINYDDYMRFDDKSVFFPRQNAKAVYFKRLKMQ